MKFTSREGKYGPIWQIAEGIRVATTKEGTYELYVTHGGQRIRKRFSDPETAFNAAELFAARLGVNIQRMDKHYTFNNAASDWVEANRVRWAESTKERYIGLLHRFILPAIGFKPLVRVTRNDVKKLIAEIYEIRSAKTAELVYAVISGIFAEAIDNGFTSENPCTGILKKVLPPKRKRESKQPDPFTQDELKVVLDVAREKLPQQIYLPIAVMSMTGMRLGEALAMHVDKLDLRNGHYMITEARRKGRLGTPKSGRRLVDIPPQLARELESYLRQLRREALKTGKVTGYLFEGITERMIQRGLERVCLAAKVRRRHPHDLRHTYATILLMQHISPAYVQKQLGHHSITMTVDIYGHWIPGQGRSQADSVWQTDLPNAKTTEIKKLNSQHAPVTGRLADRLAD
ncbi:MAG: tyrosine-type recombinase/integrase [Thermodesulforhabdaceae bacterium]